LPTKRNSLPRREDHFLLWRKKKGVSYDDLTPGGFQEKGEYSREKSR